jgi:hypothetical protein
LGIVPPLYPSSEELTRSGQFDKKYSNSRDYMKRTLILAVVLFVVPMTQGFAQTVVLTCTTPSPIRPEIKLTFDETAGTASWNDEALSRATFTDREISWDDQVVGVAFVHTNHFFLSRMTGTLTVDSQCYSTLKGASCVPQSSSVWHCEASQRKF